MDIKELYANIINNKNLWNYYNKKVKKPNIINTSDCYNFIKKFIKYSEKTRTILFDNIDYLNNNDPNRLSHIVSAFFLGLWFFWEENDFIKKAITKELDKLKCFKEEDDIEKQFTFVWFMVTLFHDLGYKSEDNENGEELPIHTIDKNNSVPVFYNGIYERYYKYRKNKEHGIYAGLIFDESICKIREYQGNNKKSRLNWRKSLEELYHYVAWIILAHSIWLKRDNDANINEYREKGLDRLILSSELKDNRLYKEYITFVDYPLFAFFCIIDTIEPIKSTSCFSKVDIKLERGKIIIKSNDSNYRKKVLSLNEWLVPTIENGNTVTIFLQDDNTI